MWINKTAVARTVRARQVAGRLQETQDAEGSPDVKRVGQACWRSDIFTLLRPGG